MKRTPANLQRLAKKIRESIPPGPPPKFDTRRWVSQQFLAAIPPARLSAQRSPAQPAPPQAVEASTLAYDKDGTRWLNQVRNEFSRRLTSIERQLAELRQFCREHRI